MHTQVGPSLQREIMAHAELRAMEAQIQKAQPLSHRLMAEESIPGAPPIPNVDMLLDKKTRMQKTRSTIKQAQQSASVFDKFEKGEIIISSLLKYVLMPWVQVHLTMMTMMMNFNLLNQD